jgi:hypothetical protein
MRTDSKDHSFTVTSHHDGVLEEDVVRVPSDIFFDVNIGALFCNHLRTFIIGVEELLINLHVHLFNEHAVSRHTVTLIEDDDVTDNEVFDVDSLRGTVLATEDDTLLIHDFGAESEELLLFTPITEGLDHAGEANSDID